MNKCLNIIFLLISLPLLANEPGHGKLQYIFQSTSDGYSRSSNQVDFTNNRRDISWQYKDAKESSWDLGSEFENHIVDANLQELNGKKFSIKLGKKFSHKFFINTKLGYHQVEVSPSKQKQSRLNHQFELQINNKDIGLISFKVIDDYMYPSMVLPAGVTDLLYGKKYELSSTLIKFKNIRARTHIKYIKYSDSNEKVDIDTEVKHHIGPEGLWLWAGIGLNHIQNEDTKSSYWSPEKFMSYSLRLEASHEVVSKLYLGAAMNIGRHQENDLTWGNGRYLNTYVQYGNRNDLNLRLAYERIKSFQTSQQWDSDQFSAQFNLFL